MQLRASGCVLLPAEETAVRMELETLRYPLGKNRNRRVFAQTFGNFELFVDGRPVAFKYSRTKEMVALLVNNRGAQTTNGEIIATLWEDEGDPKVKGSYLSNLRQDLQNTLTRLKINDIILKQRGSMSIATDRIECDLYDWLDKKEKSRYQYMGDYMNQYSWSEFFHAELDNLSYAIEQSWN
jgi:two-component SAPR family response regulator